MNTEPKPRISTEDRSTEENSNSRGRLFHTSFANQERSDEKLRSIRARPARAEPAVTGALFKQPDEELHSGLERSDKNKQGRINRPWVDKGLGC